MKDNATIHVDISIWRRIAAYLVDYFIMFMVLIPLQVIIYTVGNGFPYDYLKTGLQIELWIFLSISLPVWFYFTFSECSFHKATLGKRLFNLQVTNLSGEKISCWKAFIRTAIKLIPWEMTHLTLMLPIPYWWDPSPGIRPGIIIVYILIGAYIIIMFLNKRRQSIHDLITKTIVVNNR